MFFPAPGFFPFILTVISYGEYLGSDYSIKIWDSSHALGLKGADETSVITDQVSVAEMQSFVAVIVFHLFFVSAAVCVDDDSVSFASVIHYITSSKAVIDFFFWSCLVQLIMS